MGIEEHAPVAQRVADDPTVESMLEMMGDYADIAVTVGMSADEFYVSSNDMTLADKLRVIYAELAGRMHNLTSSLNELDAETIQMSLRDLAAASIAGLHMIETDEVGWEDSVEWDEAEDDKIEEEDTIE